VIEDYSFGRIVIDGEEFDEDVILLGEKIIEGWWRERGHSVNKKDIETILDFDPDILILGTGSSGNMKVPRSLSKRLDFEVESYPTKNAIKRYNELLKENKKVAGGFHLTC